MKDVVLATCRDHPRANADVDAFRRALTKHGIEARALPWDSKADWSSVLVHLQSPWDYQSRLEEFLAWCAHVDAVGELVHSSDLVRWNIHKGYLLEVAERGVPMLPTRLVPRGQPLDLERLATELVQDTIVIKPAVGAGARGVLRWTQGTGIPTTALEELGDEDLIVQAYARDIETRGELSIVCIEGEPFHAVEKRAAPGEYRIQEHFGGKNHVRPATSEEGALARTILERTGKKTTYARVDLVPWNDGTWCVGELELIEPELWLRHAPETADAFARALANRARG